MFLTKFDFNKKTLRVFQLIFILFLISSYIFIIIGNNNIRNHTFNIKKLSNDVKLEKGGYNFSSGVVETHLGEKWVRTDLFTSGGGETGCCFLSNNVLVISRNGGWGTEEAKQLEFNFYYLDGSIITFNHTANTAEGEEQYYGSYAITSGARFGGSMNRLIISNGYYCDGDPADPIGTYGVTANWHYNANYKFGDVRVWSSFPLIGDDIPLTYSYDKQDIVTDSGETYAISYGRDSPSDPYVLCIGKDNGSLYTEDIVGLGASWPSVGGGTDGNPVIFAWMRPGSGGGYTSGGVGIMYQLQEDTDPPTLVSGGEDVTIELGAPGSNIYWTWNDDFPFKYNITYLGNIVDQGMWTSNNPVVFNLEGLDLGTHIYTCTVNDESGNSAVDSITVIVQDTTSPQLDLADLNLQYEYGTSNQYISWTWSDYSPETYVIKRNGTQIEEGPWNSGVPINISVSGLELGVYEYLCVVNDTVGNTNQSVINVEVVDITAPILLNSPSDIYYAQGATGNVINWTWYDIKPNKYYITRNSSVIQQNDWNSSDEFILLNVDGLEPGVYYFQCHVNDTSGNSNADEVKVIVYNVTLSIFGPEDFNYVFGEKDQAIQWIATTTNNPDTYQIYKNGTFIQSGSWNSSIPIILDITGLAIGLYEFNCTVWDVSGDFVYDLVLVNVTPDTRAPSLINSSNDVEIEFGGTGNSIYWTWYDLNPNKYVIKRNGISISSSDWDANISIIENIDGLAIGSYEFVCEINDTFGNSNTYAIYVNVSDTINPILLNSSSDLSFEVGAIGFSINWSWNDLNPDNYEIIDNGTIIDEGNWTALNPIVFGLDGLGVGLHNFICIVNDTSGNSNQKLIKVNVMDTIAPQYLNEGRSFSEKVVFGVIGEYQFNCMWFDFSNLSINLIVNGTSYDVDTQQEGEYYISLSGLEPGLYNYYWYACDEYYNFNETPSKSFEIIMDTWDPMFLPPQLENNETTIPEGKEINISITVFDGEFSSGIQNVIIYYSQDRKIWQYSIMNQISIQVINETMGETSIIYNGLIPGQYQTSNIFYYIEILDNHGNDAKTEIYMINIDYKKPFDYNGTFSMIFWLIGVIGAVSSVLILGYKIKRNRKSSLQTKKQTVKHDKLTHLAPKKLNSTKSTGINQDYNKNYK
ncbi:MAG: hypothetical protein ACTSXT_03315 [Candidatus Helarchaeota archaeon]